MEVIVRRVSMQTVLTIEPLLQIARAGFHAAHVGYLFSFLALRFAVFALAKGGVFCPIVQLGYGCLLRFDHEFICNSKFIYIP